LVRLQERYGISIILIAHDLGVVAQMADEVAVMYAGSIVESAKVDTLYNRPRHPYTSSLLASRPRWDRESSEPLVAIRGTPPSLIDLPDECAFLPRCHKAINACRTSPRPDLEEVEPLHYAACYNPMYVPVEN
ncbi:MAG: oligopeptide/dipeptide ABC transporter ATP-binding protein, partial [Dehalococcoidia bacterium]